MSRQRQGARTLRVGVSLERIIAAGYCGHNADSAYRFKVYTAGQKRGVMPLIKRLMR